MKEKLLIFCPFGNFQNPMQIEVFVRRFRKKYPNFRTTDEVEKIDYRMQEVKVILITETKLLSNNYEFQFNFTNTKGRSYEIYNYRKEVSKL